MSVSVWWLDLFICSSYRCIHSLSCFWNARVYLLSPLFSFPPSNTHTHYLPLSSSLSNTQTHTHSLPHSLSLSHTHTHTSIRTLNHAAVESYGQHLIFEKKRSLLAPYCAHLTVPRRISLYARLLLSVAHDLRGQPAVENIVDRSSNLGTHLKFLWRPCMMSVMYARIWLTRAVLRRDILFFECILRLFLSHCLYPICVSDESRWILWR